MRPCLVTLFLIIFIGTWNNFFLPLVLLSKTNLYPLTVGLFIWAQDLTAPQQHQPLYPLVMIASTVSILPMVILFPFLRRYISSGITAGSLIS